MWLGGFGASGTTTLSLQPCPAWLVQHAAPKAAYLSKLPRAKAVAERSLPLPLSSSLRSCRDALSLHTLLIHWKPVNCDSVDNGKSPVSYSALPRGRVGAPKTLEANFASLDVDRHGLRSPQFYLLSRWPQFPGRIRVQGGREWRYLHRHPVQGWGRPRDGEGHHFEASEARSKQADCLDR